MKSEPEQAWWRRLVTGERLGIALLGNDGRLLLGKLVPTRELVGTLASPMATPIIPPRHFVMRLLVIYWWGSARHPGSGR